MYRCFCCADILPSNEALLRHINVTHPKLTAYRFTANHCHRSFSLYYSFWKHRCKEHSDKNLCSATTRNECSVSTQTFSDPAEGCSVENKDALEDSSSEDKDINLTEHNVPRSINQENFLETFRASLEIIVEQLCAIPKWDCGWYFREYSDGLVG